MTVPISRLDQLQREEVAFRRLLEGKLSGMTRPHLEELLRIVLAEIRVEREQMKASAQAAD